MLGKGGHASVLLDALAGREDIEIVAMFINGKKKK